MLAHTIEKVPQDPTGWLMSEKLDGVRCYWDGKKMYSRNGNQFYPPKWFADGLPKDIALDGELFTKRADFQRTVSIVKKYHADKASDNDWKEITFMVFDAPLVPGTFTDRLEVLKKSLAAYDEKIVKYHEHVVCQSQAHLDAELKKVLDKEGEGLMIKDPNSKYEGIRSKSLLKIKVMLDAEATVIGTESGTGRCSYMMGALIVQDKDGQVFKIGTGFSDAQRRNPPKKGTVITFKYQNLTKAGKYRFPAFDRVHPGL